MGHIIKPTSAMTKIKERTGKVIEVLPPGTISKKESEGISNEDLKKQFNDNLITVHMLNGSIQVRKVPFGHKEQLSPDLTKDQVDQSFVTLKELTKKPRGKVKLPRFPFPGPGKKQTPDYIDYDVATRIGNDLTWSGKHSVIGFYILFSVNSGLRVGDTTRIKHSDLIDKNPGDVLVIQEQKTGKIRNIQLNDKIIDGYKYIFRYMKERTGGKIDRFRNDYIFKSQKGTVYATISLNRILKELFAGVAPNISTHSLRKSFGRRVYEMNGRSEHALVLLSDIFGHSNLSITRRYLGLRKEEIANVYLTL